MDLLAAEDPPETLPFDDADVRAIVYVTDGEDNACVATESDVTTHAEDTRVRLYPVSYSPNGETVNTASLITLAKESGGHLYAAGTAEGLTKILGSEKSLVLDNLTLIGTNSARFQIRNIGTSSLAFSVRAGDDTEFITGINPHLQKYPETARPSRSALIRRTSRPSRPTEEISSFRALLATAPQSSALRQTWTIPWPRISAVSLRDEPGTIWRNCKIRLCSPTSHRSSQT